MTICVPDIRVRPVNGRTENRRGDYVLYWMIAARRARYNLALQHAAERARDLGVPLLVLEPLRVDYPWASERLHRFVIDGMVDNARALAKTPVGYYPYIEPRPGDGKGMLSAFARRAVLVVSDDSPAFFLPDMVAAAARELSVRLELVDGNGLYPLRATDRVFTTAASFRRHLQKQLPAHLGQLPRRDPLADIQLRRFSTVAPTTSRRWPAATLDRSPDLHDLALDHSVRPIATQGGAGAAGAALRRFLADRFDGYATLRNDPGEDCQSHLSPYLHFGHISSHEMFLAIAAREDWSPARLAVRATGNRNGWCSRERPTPERVFVRGFRVRTDTRPAVECGTKAAGRRGHDSQLPADVVGQEDPRVSTWYVTLARPSWTPPGWLFGPVWFTLYAAMAVAVWDVWRSGRDTRRAVTLFAIQLALNVAWSAVFFGMRSPGLAFVEIIVSESVPKCFRNQCPSVSGIGAQVRPEYARTTRKAIYAMSSRGYIPGVVRIRNRLLFDEAVLVLWILEKRAMSSKE